MSLGGKKGVDRGVKHGASDPAPLVGAEPGGVEDLVCNFSIKAVGHMAQV